MSRAVRRQNVGVALFPFLAVLICTMGALIVLLVLLVQQARVDASTIAAGRNSEPDQRKLRERLEDAQWRRETLQTSRDEKTQELSDSRGKLAHLEEHLQRLQQRAKELMERARLIDDGSELREDDLVVVRQELARVQAEVDQQKTKLDDARKSTARESWYALIPYDGPNGTRRRPIYLECTDQGVIVQPEGLLLGAQDFQGPLGPGNPLDAALRMIRAHLEQVHGTQAGQPYPLVVVRPSGVATYGAARAALQSWDDEFGYELIDDDKRLDFGAPDPALAAALERTVAVARRKQAAIAAMMPRRFQDEEPPQSSDAESSAAAPANPGSTGAGLGSRIGAGQQALRAEAGTAAGNGVSRANTAPQGAYGSDLAGNGDSGTGSQLGPGFGGGAPSSGQRLQPGGPTLASPDGSPATAASGEFAAGRAMNSSGNAGGAASSSVAGQAIPPGAQPGGAGGGGAFSPSRAGGQPLPNLPVGQASSRAPSTTNASSTSGGPTKGSGSKTGKNRGRNWALTGAKPHAIGVTRPLHVAVQPDRLIIVPDRGDIRAPVVVPISPEVRPGDVERFVAAVQKEVQGWGLAVANGYWRPVLHVDVLPGAEQQFANLQSALDGSGFDLVRKQP